MARGRGLLAAVEALGHGAFVADTTPVLIRLERTAHPRLIAVCDPLFERVYAGDLDCIVSTIAAGEMLVGAYRSNATAVTVIDRFLHGPSVTLVAPGLRIARSAALLVARSRIRRLSDALIAATAIDLGLPLVTGDGRLARAGVAESLLVSDYA